ncbi:MAG: Sialic acid TRAP transporter permease protein SiaT [Firmicutes bacterium ADurb.Bin153]|nr:MAG: Sialic acid TRAP transporter permease protein SiaT [Firmicutes bacterium ADurb.Bin153]
MPKGHRPALVRIMDAVDKVLVNICAVALALMVMVCLVAIFYRYILGNALSWTEELTRYLMIFVGMFGTSLALLRDEHVGFNTIVNKMPEKLKRVANVVSYVLIGTLASVIAYEGFKWTLNSGMATAQILPIKMWIPMSCIPLGGILLFAVSLTKIISELGGSDKC